MMDLIARKRCVPVIAIGDASKAQDLAEALIEGGMPLAEITLRTPASLAALKTVAANSAMYVGVGSLRNRDDVKKAHDAGARFAVSAGFLAEIADECTKANIPYFPGVATPTEILMALSAGLTTLKFFPAETLGGVAAIKAISAPFPGVTFMPTGGINATNAGEYLALKQVIAVGGSWMVAQNLIDSGDFETIIKLTKEAVELCAP